MKINHTAEQLAKLPKWAREHIDSLSRELDAATLSLQQYLDNQTPSPFYLDDWFSPTRQKVYIQSATNRICVEHARVHLEVFLPHEDDSQRLYGIELNYSAMVNGKHCLAGPTVAVVPRGCSLIQLISKENLF